MADRINGMRAELKNKLVNDLGNKNNWDHITNQIGMFAFLGISPEQVAKLSQDHHVYLTKDGQSFAFCPYILLTLLRITGRISVAGITNQNCGHLAECEPFSSLAV